MKCRYCGSPVSPEDQRCPVCMASDDFAVEDTVEENPEEEKIRKTSSLRLLRILKMRQTNSSKQSLSNPTI